MRTRNLRGKETGCLNGMKQSSLVIPDMQVQSFVGKVLEHGCIAHLEDAAQEAVTNRPRRGLALGVALAKTSLINYDISMCP